MTTRSCKHEESGPGWARRLIDTLLTLEGEGISAFGCTWYYYAHEACREDPQEAFDFFLVAGNKIVGECVTLLYRMLEPDPPAYLRPISPEKRDEEMWAGQTARWDAAVRDWYRQFYLTTHAGRMMVLRSDSPPLYHFKRPDEGADVETNSDVPARIKRLVATLTGLRQAVVGACYPHGDTLVSKLLSVRAGDGVEQGAAADGPEGDCKAPRLSARPLGVRGSCRKYSTHSH